MNTKIKYSTILEMVSRQNPDATAIVYDNNGDVKSLTFSQVYEMVQEYHVVDKKCVGILCDGSLNNIISIMAYINTGTTIVLLSPTDKPSIIQDEIYKLGIDYLVGPSELVNVLKVASYTIAPSHRIMFFTSGTTSKAKAVVLNEYNMCAAAYNGSSCLELKGDDKLLCCLPLSHVFGFVCSWLWAWENGASIILSRGVKQIFFDFNYFKPTAVSLVPQMASFLAARNMFNPELKLVLIGAGDCPDQTLNAISKMGIKVSFGYGLTETSSGIALSLGDNKRAFTICPEDDVIIANDGEILVKCPSTIFEAYFPNNDGYDDLFNEDGYYKTGDLGEFDEDGLLHLKGRKKDMLVLSDGTKIFLPEAETELANILGTSEIALGLNSNGNVVLCIGKIEKNDTINYEDKVNLYNTSIPRGQQIINIIAIPEGLPKNQTGKIKRYEINFNS